MGSPPDVEYDVSLAPHWAPHWAPHMKTIQMTIDERLLKSVDKITRARKTTRSAFIRNALEAEIQRQQILEDEIRHAAGYAAKPVMPGEFGTWLGEQDWGTP